MQDETAFVFFSMKVIYLTTKLTPDAQADFVPTQQKIKSKNLFPENRGATYNNVNMVYCTQVHIRTNNSKQEITGELHSLHIIQKVIWTLSLNTHQNKK